MVDFPEAERPVNQIVRPGWRRREERSAWVRECGCQVMLLWKDIRWEKEERESGRCTYVAIFAGLTLTRLRYSWELTVVDQTL